jgi:hypothetical protein
MADREGFEPSRRLVTVYALSRRAPSTARPPVRQEGREYSDKPPCRNPPRPSSRRRRTKAARHTSDFDSGPLSRDDDMPACTRAISAVSSAFTRRSMRARPHGNAPSGHQIFKSAAQFLPHMAPSFRRPMESQASFARTQIRARSPAAAERVHCATCRARRNPATAARISAGAVCSCDARWRQTL